MTVADRRQRRLHRRRAAVHPRPRRAVPARDRPRQATPSASPAWRSPWSPPWSWRWPAASTGLQARAADRRGADRRGDRADPGRPGADDRHARADRAVPQLRRPRRGAGRLERLPRGRGRGGGAGGCSAELLGIHHAEVVIGVFIGAVTFTGSIVAWGKLSGAVQVRAAGAARQEPAEPGRAGRVRRAHGVVRHRPDARGADRGHRHRAGCWASTWSPRSAAATCRSSCPCSTATPAGPRRPRASCSATTC